MTPALLGLSLCSLISALINQCSLVRRRTILHARLLLVVEERHFARMLPICTGVLTISKVAMPVSKIVAS